MITKIARCKGAKTDFTQRQYDKCFEEFWTNNFSLEF